MKRLFVSMLLLAFVNVFAQRPDGPRSNPLKDMTPEQVAEIKAKRMTLALDLTEQQENQVEQLLVQETTQLRERREAKRNQKEDAKKPSPEQMHANAVAHLEQRIAFKREMKSILSDEQYVQWNKMLEEKHKMRREHLKRRHARRRR